MGHPPDSGHLELAEVFRRVQTEMMGQLAVGKLFEHSPTQGNATEQQWLELFDKYLPKAYRATPAFVLNAEGCRSEQIDIAIYDTLLSPPLFSHPAGVHIPVESVYAVFEVKAGLSATSLRDAGGKAASVRSLYPRRSNKILAGILATTTRWRPKNYAASLRTNLRDIPISHRIDLGCTLDRGSFEIDRTLKVSQPDEALIFFVLRLIERLNALGPAPAADLMSYVSKLKSFRS
jgi:hypothetical protein